MSRIAKPIKRLPKGVKELTSDDDDELSKEIKDNQPEQTPEPIRKQRIFDENMKKFMELNLDDYDDEQGDLMDKNIPYYLSDEEGNVESFISNGEAYIDDNDLKELLLDFLGDDVSPEEIQKILEAASDDKLSEEDFDKLVEEFILKNKK